MRTVYLVLLLAMSAQAQITREGYDNSGTASNLNETILTADIVPTIGKIFSQPVDGAIYAQPLYVQGSPNVVYVATMNNSVYAFNADQPGPALWKVNLGKPVPSQDGNVNDSFGILSTPVIDMASGTLFCVSYTQPALYSLHALDLTSGAEKFGGPVTVTASGFDPAQQMQRPGLALTSSEIIIEFGSFGDVGTYHGWIMAYSAGQGMSQIATLNLTPSGTEGAIWMAGRAPVILEDGSIVTVTANGSYDGVTNFGQSIIRLSPSLSILDWWTPLDNSTESTEDHDLGGSGPLLVPGSSTIVAGGKQEILVSVNSASMGHLSAPAQSFTLPGHLLSGMTFLGSYLYLWTGSSALTGYHWNGSSFDTTVTGPSAPQFSFGGALASTPGVIWALIPTNPDSFDGGSQSGTLRALDSSTLTELWDSDTNPANGVGLWAKFRSPVVVNGKVYVGSATNNSQGVSASLSVYGIVVAPPTNLTAIIQ